MKRIALLACLLVGCTSLSTGPPLPEPTAARSIKTMSVPSARIMASAAPTQPSVRDVFVAGDPLLWGVWNGTAFNLPVGPDWVQITLKNPTSARLIEIDSTSDLKSWNLIGYFTNCLNGILLVDTNSAARKRFYRVGVVIQ